jgi:antitoxin component of RelBE/YafQ-DinJ toxin-antitoxin module
VISGKDERLQVRITPQLKKSATRAARRRGMTLSAVINNLLVQFVETEHAQRNPDTESI